MTATVAEALAERGHEVRVHTAGMRHLNSHEKKNGVLIQRTESFRKKEDTCTVVEMALYLVTAFFPVWRLCRAWRPDIIHAHFAVPTGALAWIIHQLTGCPYVLTAHLGDVPGGVPEQTGQLFRWLKPLTTPIWRAASGITAVSSFVAALAEKAYHLKPRIIFNGIALPSTPALKNRNRLPKIVMVGRLSVQKNMLLGLQALASLPSALAWDCAIIGDGPLRDELATFIASQGLQERVHLLGWQSGEEVKAQLQRSDILLMPSLHEGMPLAAVEAIAQGLALVASDIPGLADVLQPENNGIACPIEVPAFARALERLLQDPATLERMQKASLNLATHFDLAKAVDAYEALLTEKSIVKQRK